MSSQAGPFLALFLVFLAVVVISAVITARRARERREAMSAWAAERGFDYSEEDPRWVDHFTGKPFGIGHRRSARNVVTGSFDTRAFVAFDYRYHTTETTSDGRGGTRRREVSHPFAVVAIQTGVAFPELAVEPEGFFGRVVGKLTGNDIALESEDFNRAFTVTCPDRKFASDVLHPRQMQFLLEHRDHAFRFAGSWVITFERGAFEITEVQRRLDYVDGLIDNIPEFIWKEVLG